MHISSKLFVSLVRLARRHSNRGQIATLHNDIIHSSSVIISVELFQELIEAYEMMEDLKTSLVLFHAMKKAGFQPSDTVYESLLRQTSKQGEVEVYSRLQQEKFKHSAQEYERSKAGEE